MPLTDAQQRALSSIDWLIDTDDRSRRTGRSFVWAVAMVRRAARGARPIGQRWLYQDTIPEIDSHSQRANMQGYVQQLIASDHRLSPYVTYYPDGFILRLPQAVMDWMPPERVFDPYLNAPPGPPDPALFGPGPSDRHVDPAAPPQPSGPGMMAAQRLNSAPVINPATGRVAMASEAAAVRRGVQAGRQAAADARRKVLQLKKDHQPLHEPAPSAWERLQAAEDAF